MFDTKIAILVEESLAPWQKLNVTAFLASGIAGAHPEAMGAAYVDASGRAHAALLGQPVMVLAATPDRLRAAHQKAQERGLTCAAYVRAMFATGHDAANREAFAAEDPAAPDLVGLALYGAKRDVDKAAKGAVMHP